MNLIKNGNFTTQTLSPWTSATIEKPSFEPYKGGGTESGYSLLLTPSTDIQQKIEVSMPDKDFKLSWELDACIDSKASLGKWLFIIATARVDNKFFIDQVLFTELTHEWKKFKYQGTMNFPKDHEGLYLQVISARKVDGEGTSDSPIQIANIGLEASYL